MLSTKSYPIIVLVSLLVCCVLCYQENNPEVQVYKKGFAVFNMINNHNYDNVLFYWSTTGEITLPLTEDVEKSGGTATKYGEGRWSYVNCNDELPNGKTVYYAIFGSVDFGNSPSGKPIFKGEFVVGNPVTESGSYKDECEY